MPTAMIATFIRTIPPPTAAPILTRWGEKGIRELECTRNPNPNPEAKPEFLDWAGKSQGRVEEIKGVFTRNPNPNYKLKRNFLV